MDNGQSMQRSVLDIIEEIRQGSLNPKLLSDSLLDACIEYLHFEQGEPQYEIAPLLQRNRNTISLHAKRILKKKAEELKVRGIDVYEIAQRLKWNTELVMYQARKEKDWRLYNDAYHKYIDRMQSLGVIYKAPDQLELHSLSEEKWEEIQSVILETLEGFPDAKLALISALKQKRLTNGSNGKSNSPE